MNCINIIDDHGNPCGDEGRMCDDCFQQQMKDYAWLRHVSKYAVMPIDEDFREEMRDAGRGHLVKP